MFHEYILLPGWLKKAQFEALCQWLESQGFVIVRANGPVPWQTYPSVKFNGTVAQFNQTFHVTVMDPHDGTARDNISAFRPLKIKELKREPYSNQLDHFRVCLWRRAARYAASQAAA